MTAQELLDELRKNILRDTSGLVSGDPDLLYDDESLLRYINDAYYRFCRKSLSLFDSTTKEVTQLKMKEGEDIYSLHKSILAVVSARLEDEPVDMVRTGHGVLDTPFRTEDSLYFDVNLIQALPPGKPLAFATDEHDTAFRVYPNIGTDYDGKVVSLRVIRMPLVKLSVDTLDSELEIREEYQLGMLNWAAYLALSNNDLDVENMQRARNKKEEFNELVADALRESKRRRFSTAAWAFGRNGFAWEK